MTWEIKVLTLFTELYPGPLSHSVVGNALASNVWSLQAKNIRDFAFDKHKTVDDTSYGGGDGMVAKPDVIANAIEGFFDLKNPIIYLSPRGKPLTQERVHQYSVLNGLNILCGRFEGVDERIFLEYSIEELSVGDYVLSCGDLAAYVLLDACVRCLPGVLPSNDALAYESFGIGKGYENLLEYPHYTKPSVWRSHKVPGVLLSGNHKEIEKWRFEKAMEKTIEVRPDLLDRCKTKIGDKND